MESYNIATHPAKNKITVIIRKARIPLVTLAAGILLGVLLSAFISPMLAAHVKIAPVQSIISEFCPNQQLILEDVPIKSGDVVSAVPRQHNTYLEKT